MHKYKINNSTTIYVMDEYINSCIKESKKYHMGEKIKSYNKFALGESAFPQKKIHIKALPDNTKVMHKKYGSGVVITTNNKGYMSVKFSSDKVLKFMYPEAFQKGYLAKCS